MSDEYWDKWFENRRRRWPFFRGGFFGDMDEMVRDMEEFMQRQFEEFSKMTPKDLVKERTMPDGSKVREFGPFVYGYSMRIGPDGKPEVREFGNVKPGARYGQPRVNISEEREPLVDVTETNNEVHIIAELPGVEKEDIKMHGTDTSLTIDVDTAERKYHKVVELPAKVDTKETKASYKNGVLEVTLPKKEDKEPKGEPILL
jgi:HSP20 family protein